MQFNRLRYCFIIIFIQCFALKLFGQRTPVAATFSPLALLDDFRYPLIQGGFETPIKKGWSCFTEVGIKYRNSFMDGVDSAMVPSKGYRIKLELRHYSTKKNKENMQPYWATGIELQKEQHNTGIQYYKMPDTVNRLGDEFGVFQSGWAFHVAYGLVHTWSRHFCTDVYVGLSVRYRFNETIGLEYLPGKDRMIRSVDPSFADSRALADLATEGNWRPRLLAGIRLQLR